MHNISRIFTILTWNILSRKPFTPQDRRAPNELQKGTCICYCRAPSSRFPLHERHSRVHDPRLPDNYQVTEKKKTLPLYILKKQNNKNSIEMRQYPEAKNEITDTDFVAFRVFQRDWALAYCLMNAHPFVFLFPEARKSHTNKLS